MRMSAVCLFAATLSISSAAANACTLAPVIAVEDLPSPIQGSNGEALSVYGKFLVGLVERMHVKVWPAQAGHSKAYAIATVRFWGERPVDDGVRIYGGEQVQSPPTTTSCGSEPERLLGDLHYLAQWDEGHVLPVEADWLTFSQELFLEEVFGPAVEVAVPNLSATHPRLPEAQATTASSAATAAPTGLEAPNSPWPMTIVGLGAALALLLVLRRRSSR